MAETKPNKGGRPSRYGEPTKAIRVPVSKIPAVRDFLDGGHPSWVDTELIELLRRFADNPSPWDTTAAKAQRILERLGL